MVQVILNGEKIGELPHSMVEVYLNHSTANIVSRTVSTLVMEKI